MTPKRLTNFRIDDEILEALDSVNAREPEGLSWHVRKAIREYAERKGVKVKTERKRAITRKRS